jgi:succinate dehydrogenase / fumarate reductase cytochrome b subunit
MKIKQYLSSSIGRKQIVALTGLGLIFFVIAHLAGNLLIFKGPDAFNQYASTLKSLGALLQVARVGLIAMFVAHIWFTVLLIIENKSARGQAYEVKKDIEGRSFATKTMKYTGPLVAFFLLIHLLDFTLPTFFVRNPIYLGIDLGLYGIVANSFQNPLRVLLYVLAMISIGCHLSHGIQSTAQTFGAVGTKKNTTLKKGAITLGTIIAIGFSSIPLYLYLVQYMPNCQRSLMQSYRLTSPDTPQILPDQPAVKACCAHDATSKGDK